MQTGYVEENLLPLSAFDLTGLQGLQQGFTLTYEEASSCIIFSLNLKNYDESIVPALLTHCQVVITAVFGYLQESEVDPSRGQIRIKSEDRQALKQIEEFLEAIQSWSRKQQLMIQTLAQVRTAHPRLVERIGTNERSWSKPSYKRETTPPSIHASSPRLAEGRTNSLTDSSGPEEYQISTESTLSATSLFFANPPLSYVRCFRSFQKQLLVILEGTTQASAIQSLLISIKTPLEKAIFLDAFESIQMKLQAGIEREKEYAKKIRLSSALQAFRKKPKVWGAEQEQLIQSYWLYLNNQTTEVTSTDDRQAIQWVMDVCLIFLASLKEMLNQMSVSRRRKWDEKTFFRTFSVEQVSSLGWGRLFDQSLSWKKPGQKLTLMGLWKNIYASLVDYLPLDLLLQEKKALETKNAMLQERYKEFLSEWKKYLKLTPNHRWRQRWLYNREWALQNYGGKKGFLIHSFFHLSHAFQTAARFSVVDDQVFIPPVSGILGSTYFGSAKPLDEETTLCMDANYQCGTAGATADGYGHFPDIALNRHVHQAAYRTVKLAVRYANFYTSAEALYHDLPPLMTYIGHAVKYSFMHPEAAGTASCVLTKYFQGPHSDTMVIVAAGVGDGMVIAWDPNKSEVETLIKPRQYDRGGQFTPISITEPHKGGMLQRTMKTFPYGTIIIRLTDGGWQSLPYIRSDVLEDAQDKRRYLEYSIDREALAKRLQAFAMTAPRAGAREYRHYLQNLIQTSVVQQKEFLGDQSKVIIPRKLEEFKSSISFSSTPQTLNMFLEWAEKQDPAFHNDFVAFIDLLNLSLDSLRPMRLTDFKLNELPIMVGDDIAINVEVLGKSLPAPTSTSQTVSTPSPNLSPGFKRF